MKAVGPDPTADGLLARDLAMIGVAALCGLTLRGIDVVDRAWRVSTPVSAAALISCAMVSLWSAPPDSLAHIVTNLLVNYAKHAPGA